MLFSSIEISHKIIYKILKDVLMQSLTSYSLIITLHCGLTDIPVGHSEMKTQLKQSGKNIFVYTCISFQSVVSVNLVKIS